MQCAVPMLFAWNVLEAQSHCETGTTTATVLTRAILMEGCKSVAAGMNPMDLRRGIHIAVDAVLEDLKSRAKMISTTAEIAQVKLLLKKLISPAKDPPKLPILHLAAYAQLCRLGLSKKNSAHTLGPPPPQQCRSEKESLRTLSMVGMTQPIV